MPRPVRSSSSIFASAELPRFVFTRVSCWCSCVEVKTGGASSSPMFCRSSTIQNNCSSSLRTGNAPHWSPELGLRKELFRSPQISCCRPQAHDAATIEITVINQPSSSKAFRRSPELQSINFNTKMRGFRCWTASPQHSLINPK